MIKIAAMIYLIILLYVLILSLTKVAGDADMKALRMKEKEDKTIRK